MNRDSKSINKKKIYIRFTYLMFYLVKVSPIALLTIQKRQCIRLFSNCLHSVICNKCMLVIYFHVCCTCKGLDKLKVPMLKEILKKSF